MTRTLTALSMATLLWSCGSVIRLGDCVTTEKSIVDNFVLGRQCRTGRHEEVGIWRMTGWTQYNGGDSTPHGLLYLYNPDQILIDTTYLCAKNAAGQMLLIHRSPKDSIHWVFRTKKIDRYVKMAKRQEAPDSLVNLLVNSLQNEIGRKK